ncbi:cytidylyltransferase domain-containing protein [Candidatus Magnetominusculus xianensis]|uniref:Acylneuraminate cytidylyltransferase n=1 Tax=Candidatus Magnetominusculus xianensis TaxID=1748249 RepID=A0ABR5SD35_9BACT|nr:glycosyltransferase family protein [Candidatus Magnetominusculus xianensis]KWT78303.1 acylneuraminate cytidylyltransferase [Candidatus Magnetominusculus xianensis]MBF0404010.1 glycosyltransferase family protein [Nitrospirota bacterium]
MKKAVIIQARMSSSRFPAKMMSVLAGVPLVRFVYERCLNSKEADIVAVATSNDPSDDKLYEYCRAEGIPVFRGSLDNVLERYVRAAEFYGADVVCRVCGDSPFADPALSDNMFNILDAEGVDYAAPVSGTYIAGLDSEVIRVSTLNMALRHAADSYELEHVTPYIKKNAGIFKIKLIDVNLRPNELSGLVLTVDYPGDLDICSRIAALLGQGYNFTSHDIFDALLYNKAILKMNRGL